MTQTAEPQAEPQNRVSTDADAPYGYVHALDTGSRLRAATPHETTIFLRTKGTNEKHWWSDEKTGQLVTVICTDAEGEAATKALADRKPEEQGNASAETTEASAAETTPSIEPEAPPAPPPEPEATETGNRGKRR